MGFGSAGMSVSSTVDARGRLRLENRRLIVHQYHHLSILEAFTARLAPQLCQPLSAGTINMFRTCRFKGTTDATCTTSWIQASRTQACRIRLAHQPHSCRAASTSANPYPFPKAAHPTPHQIFHLPRSATRADVKARCTSL